jgi:hypothetical protein
VSRLRTGVEVLEAQRDKAEGFIVTRPGETAEAAIRRHGVPPDRWDSPTVIVIRSFDAEGASDRAPKATNRA